MPKPYDDILVSGAGDCRIRMHNLKTAEPTFVCKCHKQRIKRIATVPSVPFLFWSVGEDGLVLQYDVRMQHVCRTNDQSVLVNLIYHMGHGAEGKCIAANPRKPELIAIGANDAYVRMYDRRMIKLSQVHLFNKEESEFFIFYSCLRYLINLVPINCSFLQFILHMKTQIG